MDKKMIQLLQDLPRTHGCHIFYYSNEVEFYLQNAVSFAVSGIVQGEHILFVENDRLYPMLHKELQKCLTEDQLSKIHFINNFDFYWQNGDFHPPTILSSFSTILDSYLGESRSIRTWGHVEWGNLEEIMKDLVDYENRANQMMLETNIVSICAYNAERVPDVLKLRLMKAHGYLMTDDDLIRLNN